MDQSDIHSNLVNLIQRLNQAEIDWDAENIVDWLWLSRYLGETAIETEELLSEPEPSLPISTELQAVTANDRPLPPELGLAVPPPIALAAAAEQQAAQPAAKGIPFPTPTAPALRQTLAIGRALRPLMRKVDSYTQMVLDEEATAEQTAEQQVCLTVVQPDQERWLEVALVIEESASSFLWQETIRDFKQVLERQGAFRSIGVWYLQTSPAGDMNLFAKRPSPAANPQPRSPKELIDAANRRLILLVSDCISPAWRSERLYSDYLQIWANGLFAIVQMLPSHLWRRTALNAALSAQFGARKPGAPNHQLLFREIPIGSMSDPTQGLKIPVVTLDPDYLEPWGRMVAKLGESWAIGVWFDEDWQSLTLSVPPAAALTAEQLVQRFDTTASVLARRLSELMAIVPISLPIIYLLQETLLPDSTPLHIAEVFMSGLIQQQDEALSDETDSSDRAVQVYEFVPGVRELLSSSLPATTAEAVLNQVSQYIGTKLGRSIYSFTALLMLEQELCAAGGSELLRFAQITKQVLRQMGGSYAALVDAIEPPAVVPPSPVPNADSAAFPPLQILEFTTAQLIDPALEPTPENPFPPLQTQEVEVVTIVFEDTPEDLELFEFEVATIEHRTDNQQPGFRQRLGSLFSGSEQQSDWVIRKQRRQAYQWIERLSDDLRLEMVAIPAGTFLMGSPEGGVDYFSNESPQHEVSVPSFFMSKYPVTQAQWRFIARLAQVDRGLNPDPSQFRGDRRPIEQVSWYKAVEFCNRLSVYTGQEYRLPTEAEWEYACRAGTIAPFHFGETITTDLSNYNGTYSYNDEPKGEYRQETTPIDFFGITNTFGLCDMHGNVWEWCQDHWHNNYNGAPIDGSAWLGENENKSHVLRGGSWDSYPRVCRSASRSYHQSDYAANNVGFRVVCVAPAAL